MLLLSSSDKLQAKVPGGAVYTATNAEGLDPLGSHKVESCWYAFTAHKENRHWLWPGMSRNY